MKKISILKVASALFLGSNYVMAENLKADKCQVFVKAVAASPSSHGVNSISAIVGTSVIGNGEKVQKVGFYGKVETNDLGNAPFCGMGSRYTSDWKVYESTNDYSNLSYGEVRFHFPVLSGSVLGACQGYEWSWIGSFFVETDRNTYWVNPDFDSNKNFYFDYNASTILMSKGGWSGNGRGLATSRGDMKYYNPGNCQ